MRLVAFAAALLSTTAWAWPVEKVIELELGKDTILRMGAADWFEIDDPKVVSAEVLDSGDEMLFTPKAAGRALMMTYIEGKPLVWSIHVGKPFDPKAQQASLAATLKACPKLAHKPGEYEKLVGDVLDAKCRSALLETLKLDLFEAKDVSLTIEAQVLVAQLNELRAALTAAKSPVAAHYEGATLVLEGKTDLPALKRALWEAFRHSAFRVALDNRAEVEVDGGSPPPSEEGAGSAKRRP